MSGGEGAPLPVIVPELGGRRESLNSVLSVGVGFRFMMAVMMDSCW